MILVLLQKQKFNLFCVCFAFKTRMSNPGFWKLFPSSTLNSINWESFPSIQLKYQMRILSISFYRSESRAFKVNHNDILQSNLSKQSFWYKTVFYFEIVAMEKHPLVLDTILHKLISGAKTIDVIHNSKRFW